MRKDFVPVAHESTFLPSLVLDKILTERDPTRSCVTIRFLHNSPILTTAEVAHALSPLRILQYEGHQALAEFPDKNFLIIRQDGKIWQFHATGDLEWAQSLRAKYENVLAKKGRIRWFYSHKDDIENKTFELDTPHPIYDELYPFIPNGIEAYLNAYFASRASILVMMGPPGTGKTSLLRHMLYQRNLTAAVTFDEKVMATEEYFINFASGDNDGLSATPADVMIVEDADLLLSSRESEQNKIMSKLLNVSEGLIPLDCKKMIFTTNLPNINRIDPALIRPGRCFDVLNFRALTVPEAEAAAKAAGISFTPTTKETTLAAIFNSARANAEKTDGEKFKLIKTA